NALSTARQLPHRPEPCAGYSWRVGNRRAGGHLQQPRRAVGPRHANGAGRTQTYARRQPELQICAMAEHCRRITTRLMESLPLPIPTTHSMSPWTLIADASLLVQLVML